MFWGQIVCYKYENRLFLCILLHSMKLIGGKMKVEKAFLYLQTAKEFVTKASNMSSACVSLLMGFVMHITRIFANLIRK